MESIGTRGCRFLKGEVRRLGQSHPSVKVRDCDRKFLGIEEFLAARCPCCGVAKANTRHARLPGMSVIGRAGEPASAPGARALPHLSGYAHSSLSGKRSPLPRKQRFAYGHCYPGGSSPRCYGIGVSQPKQYFSTSSMRTQKRESTRREDSKVLQPRSIATTPYCPTSRMRAHKRGSTYRQAALTDTDQLLSRLRRARVINAIVRDR